MLLPRGLEITFLGHASFRLVTPERKIVYIDAWLGGNPVCPEELKHVDQADMFLITHGHGDHLDADLPEIAKRTGATVVGPAAVTQLLRAQGVEKLEFLNYGGMIDLDGIKVTMTQSYHASNINTPEGPAYPHAASGFVIELPSGFRIHHAGDTGICADMKVVGDLYHPDLSMLPIGDRATMGPMQAAYAARYLQTKCVIPIHYGTFPMLTGTLEEFEKHMEGTGIEVRAMKAGETWLVENTVGV